MESYVLQCGDPTGGPRLCVGGVVQKLLQLLYLNLISVWVWVQTPPRSCFRLMTPAPDTCPRAVRHRESIAGTGASVRAVVPELWGKIYVAPCLGAPDPK
jgi:hypothetical protein